MSRVETASGAKYSTHKEPARKFEPIGPVGTNYTPIGKVDINAIRKEAAVKPPPPPQPTTSRPPGVGQQWSKPVTTGFQPRYTAPPPVKSTPAPDDDWGPASTPVKPTPAPSLPTATRPTPPAPAVSLNNLHPYSVTYTDSSHSPLRMSLSQLLLPPNLLRMIALGLLGRTGNRSNFPNQGNSSIRSRDVHRRHSRSKGNKQSLQLRGRV